MADEPKPPAGGPPKPAAPAPAPSAADPFIEIVSLVGGVFIVLYLLSQLFMGISSSAFFNHGLKGLTPQGIIFYHTRPIASLNNPIGADVVALHDLSVFQSPGENQIGTQLFNARGKILQGPVQVGGINYYYVDFNSGQDGWVQEGSIGYLMSEPNTIERVIMWFYKFVFVLRVLAYIISVILMFVILYIVRELGKLRVIEKKLLYPVVADISAPMVNPKWEKIVAHIDSNNENDWRLAILEADIMLSDLLDTMSLTGETIGEKLKAVEKSDFTTIDQAWEAHKIRNQIAHEGSEFQLTQREARRVIELYRVVFNEFQII